MKLEQFLSEIDTIVCEGSEVGHARDRITLFSEGYKLMTLTRDFNFNLFRLLEFLRDKLYKAEPKLYMLATWQEFKRSEKRKDWGIEIYYSGEAVRAAKVLERKGFCGSFGHHEELVFVTPVPVRGEDDEK